MSFSETFDLGPITISSIILFLQLSKFKSAVLDADTEQVFTFLKNPAFIEEKEVRIVYNTGIYNEIDTGELREALSEKIEIGTKKPGPPPDPNLSPPDIL